MDKLVKQTGIAEISKIINDYDAEFTDELVNMFGKDALTTYWETFLDELVVVDGTQTEEQQLSYLKSVVIDFYKKEFGVE